MKTFWFSKHMTESAVTAEDTLRVAIGPLNACRYSIWRVWFGPRDIFAAYPSLAYMRRSCSFRSERICPTGVAHLW